MKFSRTTKAAGGSGFHVDNDAHAPADAVSVTDTLFKAAIAARADGNDYDVNASGAIIIIPAPVATAAEILAEAQAKRIAELSAECQAHIYAGFQSSALGSPHTYPAKDRDQGNLAGSVVASLLPGLPANWSTPFWCADAAGAWAFVPHTAAQIQQVGADGKSAIVAALTKNATLAAQVMAATLPADVSAIVW